MAARTEPEVMDLAILRIALSQAMVSGLTGNAFTAWPRCGDVEKKKLMVLEV
jgi:hypothetical protein